MRRWPALAATNRGCSRAVDVDESCYWWDYGQLGLYLKGNVLAMADSERRRRFATTSRFESRVAGSNSRVRARGGAGVGVSESSPAR